MDTKTKETAMKQLLNQLREERSKLPLPAEWDRCYQAIEMMIVSTYIPIEKEQICDAVNQHYVIPENYYRWVYGK